MGRPTKYRPELCDRLLEMMSDGKSVMQFCSEVGISRDTFYRWTHDNDDFSDTFTRAKAKCEAYWEAKMQQAMFDRDTNAPLMKFYLANRFGWSDKQTLDSTVVNKRPMTLADFYGGSNEQTT